jgi:hypothetical protein
VADCAHWCKRAYFTYLAEAKAFSEATLDAAAKALNRFESYTRFRDFKAFQIEQAEGFKANLSEQMSLRTKDHLSKGDALRHTHGPEAA